MLVTFLNTECWWHFVNTKCWWHFVNTEYWWHFVNTECWRHFVNTEWWLHFVNTGCWWHFVTMYYSRYTWTLSHKCGSFDISILINIICTAPPTLSRKILCRLIMAQFKAETCSCRFSLTNIRIFRRIFIGSYIIRTTKYIMSRYSPKYIKYTIFCPVV